MIIKPFSNIYQVKNYANSYIVEFKDHLIIIDAGMDKKAKELIEAIEKTGKKPTAALITHGHLDHINGLAKLKEKYPEMKVVTSEEDKAAVEGKKYLLPKSVKGFFFRLFMPFMYKPVKVDETFGETYEVFEIIKTPGHTKGSVSFLFDKNLFCGDLILNSKGLSLPSEEFNLDNQTMTESLGKISNLDFDYLLPGHGDIVKDAKKEIKNFLETIH